MYPDVYFLEAYADVSSVLDHGVSEVFSFDGSEGSVKYPFVKREIDSSLAPGRFDIITPYGYGGPLLPSDLGPVEQRNLACEFMNEFASYCRDNQVVSEFVRFHPLEESSVVFAPLYDAEINRHTVVTQLHGDDPIMREFDKKVRWRGRKNASLGLTTRIYKPSTLLPFIELYNLTMDRNRASEYYYFDETYFSSLLASLDDRLILAEAHFEGKLVGAILCLLGAQRIHIHLAGTDPDYLAISPTTSIMHALVTWGVENDYLFIHQGGGRTSAADDSLFQFKKKLGSGLADFRMGRVVHDQSVYQTLCVEAGAKDDSGFFPAYRA